MKKILRSPTFETKIFKAVFLNQEIIVFPRIRTINAEWEYKEVKDV